MSEVNWIPDLPFPVHQVKQLKRAFSEVAQFRRQQPEQLYRWEPEAPLEQSLRAKHELILAITLVQVMQAGDGSYESRLNACQKLYKQGLSAPVEGVRAAELLLRSRMITGVTDIETFWLAATFAHPLRAIVPEVIGGQAWRYLQAAPFAVHIPSALEFTKASQIHRDGLRPRWPWELAEALMVKAEQRALCITLLESMVCTHLKVQRMELAAAKLPLKASKITPLFADVIIRLSTLYIEGNYDTIYAREVARQASDLGDSRATNYLESHVFDIPYTELAVLVKNWLKGTPIEIDVYYRKALERGQLHVARRLTELELLYRLGGKKRGAIYPRLEAAIQGLVEQDPPPEDPRLSELLMRVGLLYSRTNHYTPAARMLVRKLHKEVTQGGEQNPLSAMSHEFETFMQECDPYHTLERAQKAMEVRLEALDAEARQVLEESHNWLFSKIQLKPDVVARAAHLMHTPGDGEKNQLIRSAVSSVIERALMTLHNMGPLIVDTPRLQREIAAQAGVPWHRLQETSAGRLKNIAQGYARLDQLSATAGGALTGLLGGPWGAAVDLLSLTTLAARAVARIGLVYGIEPGTPEAFHLLAGSLSLASSTNGGEGVISLLHAENARQVRPVVLGGVLYSAEQVTRLAPALTGKLIQGVARQVGFSLGERQILRMVPLLGAVFSAGTDYLFLKAVTEAAVQLGARHFLMGPNQGLSLKDPA